MVIYAHEDHSEVPPFLRANPTLFHTSSQYMCNIADSKKHKTQSVHIVANILILFLQKASDGKNKRDCDANIPQTEDTEHVRGAF